jgi:carboxypeptidase Taq
MNAKVTDLKKELRSIANLESILGLLEWDQQVNMPAGGHELRSEQVEAFTRVIHDASTSDKLGRLIDAAYADREQLVNDDQLVVDGAAKQYNRLTRIPEAFAAKKAAAQSRAYQTWLKARDENAFAGFVDELEEQIELCRQEAQYVDPHADAYEYLVDYFDPGMTIEAIDQVFRPLAPALAKLCEAAESRSQATIDLKSFSFAEEPQKAFLMEVVKKIGFDFGHGRIDTSVHPFCSGTGTDIRMTTRYKPDNPLDSLYSSIHECGHALYEQGLDPAEFGNVLGAYCGMSVHESQSRLWENQVARSRAFWEYWWPRYRDLFTPLLDTVSFESWMAQVLEVRRIPIRVDSDEVSYNLHIFVRYELERDLFEGRLKVRDLRDAWNAKYEQYLALTPESDVSGVLQDVHWASGAFGYFPSYTMGTILSAQFWDAMGKNLPNLHELVQKADYAPILEWLRRRIHSVGRRLDAKSLVSAVTGESLSEQPLIRYLSSKYL